MNDPQFASAFGGVYNPAFSAHGMKLPLMLSTLGNHGARASLASALRHLDLVLTNPASVQTTTS